MIINLLNVFYFIKYLLLQLGVVKDKTDTKEPQESTSEKEKRIEVSQQKTEESPSQERSSHSQEPPSRTEQDVQSIQKTEVPPGEPNRQHTEEYVLSIDLTVSLLIDTCTWLFRYYWIFFFLQEFLSSSQTRISQTPPIHRFFLVRNGLQFWIESFISS